MRSINSAIATGFEIDELSADGQTYTTVDTVSSSLSSYTIFPADPSSEATYYVYATDQSGTNYSDPATAVPVMLGASLGVADGGIADTSITLAYSNPTQVPLTLYWQAPGDANMHAYEPQPDLSAATGTFEIGNLIPGTTYNFMLDAFDGVQDAQTAVISPTTTTGNAGDQPEITGYTVESDSFGNNGGLIDVTFESQMGNDGAWLYLSRGDDPYGLFYQTPLPANSPYIDGDGGAIPALSCTSTDGYNWDATFYLPASNVNVSIQIGLLPADGIPLSTPVNNVAVGFYPGDTYAPPPAPILTPTLDSSGDLTIAYTGTPPAAGNNGGGTSFYAVTGPTTAVPLTDYTDNDDGTITIPAGSTYSGDAIFAATFEWLFYYGDESPYWSPYSNYVNGVGLPPTTSTTLLAPSDLTVDWSSVVGGSGIGDQSYDLHWMDNAPNESGVEIVARQSTAGNTATWVVLDTLSMSSTSDIITPSQVINALGVGHFDLGIEAIDSNGDDSTVLFDPALPLCFAAGTLILLVDGSTRPIEKLETGLKVRVPSDSDPEGTQSTCRIVDVYHNKPAEIWHVNVGGNTISATGAHPFYVRGKGWVAVKDLAKGDRLLSSAGEDVKVRSVVRTGKSEAVFNFQVEVNRTYFVVPPGGSHGVLVHNYSGGRDQGEEPHSGTARQPSPIIQSDRELDDLMSSLDDTQDESGAIQAMGRILDALQYQGESHAGVAGGGSPAAMQAYMAMLAQMEMGGWTFNVDKLSSDANTVAKYVSIAGGKVLSPLDESLPGAITDLSHTWGNHSDPTKIQDMADNVGSLLTDSADAIDLAQNLAALDDKPGNVLRAEGNLIDLISDLWPDAPEETPLAEVTSPVKDILTFYSKSLDKAADLIDQMSESEARQNLEEILVAHANPENDTAEFGADWANTQLQKAAASKDYDNFSADIKAYLTAKGYR